MTDKHTPEPWEVTDKRFIRQSSGRRHVVARVVGSEEMEANARRIVACINACAGSSTEWLEFIVSDDVIEQFGQPRPFEARYAEVLREALRIMCERDKAEKQRDELLAVATMAVEMILTEAHERRYVRQKLKDAIASVKESK